MTHVPTSHPELETLAAFVDGRLSGAERASVVEHLASCDDCLEVVAETAAVQEELDAETSSPGQVVRQPGAWRRWMPAVASPRMSRPMKNPVVGTTREAQVSRTKANWDI